MGKYILKRTGMMAIILFLIVSIAFFVLRLMPGSPYEDDQDLTQEAIDALNAKLHLDKPLIVQYGYFLKGVAFENDWVPPSSCAPVYPCSRSLWSASPPPWF